MASSRWRERYALRLAIVLQPRAPLALALGQLSSLTTKDLARVAEAPGSRPLVQAAAARVAAARAESGKPPGETPQIPPFQRR